MTQIGPENLSSPTTFVRIGAETVGYGGGIMCCRESTTRRDGVAAADQERVDQAALHAAKQTLRSAVRRRREARRAEERSAADTARHAVLIAALGPRRPRCVAAYLSAGTEPDTLRLVAWLAARDVRVLLPVLSDGAGRRLPEPAWAAYGGPDSLRGGWGGIAEPAARPQPGRALADADVVVVPGLAANLRGDRLGRGGGWYDRTLGHAAAHAPVWLLLNDDEVLPEIPAQPWDRPVDALITPNGLIDCRRLSSA